MRLVRCLASPLEFLLPNGSDMFMRTTYAALPGPARRRAPWGYPLNWSGGRPAGRSFLSKP